MPRPENVSRMKTATPILLSSCAQRSCEALTPPEPCTRITAGNRSLPGRGMRSSPASTTGLPLVSPVRNCSPLSVTLSMERTSMRANVCAAANCGISVMLAAKIRWRNMHASWKVAQSLDHFVSAREKGLGYFDTERFGSLQIDHQLKLARLLDR